ncbi:hypothetical protein LVJ94_41195 [Pendulispora rubella]|uniref:Uncharacterized protein n=1 Tax=Pendulispora rubella TaxID=2741070 RepID=A0ABZ2KXA3_9BACT
MFIRKALTVLVVASSVLGIPAVSLAAGSPPCELREHHIVSVEPYRPEERFGRASLPVLRGARIYVQAEPGLTAEWLRHSLAGHLAAQQSDCALDVDGLKVDVESAGSGFRVTLSSPDSERRGEEILRRARRLVG